MKKILVSLIVLAIFASGCVNYGGNQATPPAGSNSVSIMNYAFNPSVLNVPAGTTVTWTNGDSVVHTVTSDSGAFDSGQIPSGQTFSYTFNTAGTYTYHCAVHPSMKATIVVGQ